MYTLIKSKLFWLVTLLVLITSTCNAAETVPEESNEKAAVKPDKNNIVSDVTQLKSLYSSVIPIGVQAPYFKLKDLDSKEWDTGSLFKDSVNILYFWSVFCPYCKESFPLLIPIYNKYKQNGVKMLAVNLDGVAFSNAIKSFLVSEKITFPVPIDELYQSNFFHAADPYGVSKTPTIFLVDKNGKIIYEAEVDIDYTLLEKLIEENIGASKVKSKVIIVLVAVASILVVSVLVFVLFVTPKITRQKQ